MRRALLTTAVCLLAACDSGGISTPAPADDPVTEAPPPVTEATFEISTTNLTLGQPFSPIAVVIHDSNASAFEIGSSSTVGLETLAESGDNSALLTELDGLASVSGESPVGPGGNDVLTVSLPNDQVDGLSISVVTMLVNTNDAITGVNAMDLSQLAVGETASLSTVAYDAGTEANTELAGTIPGPADGGEGFNEARDDVADFLTMHPGVVTADDGLSESVLNQMHRFDNPVARFSITRTQ